MTDFAKTITRNWQDGVNFILGLWLFFSAWILGFASVTAAFWNALIVGAVIVVLAVAAIMAWKEWEEWVGMVLGAWLVISPWVLGFTGFANAVWNAVIVGLIVFVLAAWSLYAHKGEEAGAH